MAVTAVDAVAGDVPLVAELNGLFAGNVRFGHPRRAIEFRDERKETRDEEEPAENTDARNRVRAAVEDLHSASRRSARKTLRPRKPAKNGPNGETRRRTTRVASLSRTHAES